MIESSSSPLLRQIARMNVLAEISVHELKALTYRLPNLQSLGHRAWHSKESHPRLYPSQLHELSLNLEEEEGEDALVAQMENLRSATGLRSPTLTLPDNAHYIRSFSLKPLEHMLDLESLTLHGGSV